MIALSPDDARWPRLLTKRLIEATPPIIWPLGNLDLLELPKTALFCSACCPGDAILDKADEVLAQHFGITPEELDFILNYDIKYRLGCDTETEEE